MGLAVQNYHDVHNSLPAGCPWLPVGVSVQFTLFPYLEKKSNSDTLLSSGGWEQMTIADFRCPSDSTVPSRPDVCNYVICYADWSELPANSNQLGNANRTKWGPLKNFRSAIVGGPYWRGDFSSINDGLSNTIVFSERCVGPGGNLRMVKVGVAYGNSLDVTVPLSNGDTKCDAIPKTCLDSRNGNDYKSGINTCDIGGFMWHRGAAACTGFNTILAPNAPSCYNPNNPGHSGNLSGDFWDRYLGSAGSFHSGGVNAVRYDGSVQFFTETINCGDPSVSPPNSGASPYGIWGALGSINGGETITF
jgi:hypothetical protein